MMSMHWDGIILAAGRGRRMGGPKHRLPWGDADLLNHLCNTYLAAGAHRIFCVVPEDGTADRAGDAAIHYVQGDAERPMIHSLRRAMRRATAPWRIAQPVDAPFTTVPLLHALLDAADRAPSPARAIVPFFGDQPGHPVCLPAALTTAIKALPDGGLRRILGEAGHVPMPWADEKILADLDTPEDLERWTGGIL